MGKKNFKGKVGKLIFIKHTEQVFDNENYFKEQTAG